MRKKRVKKMKIRKQICDLTITYKDPKALFAKKFLAEGLSEEALGKKIETYYKEKKELKGRMTAESFEDFAGYFLMRLVEGYEAEKPMSKFECGGVGIRLNYY